MTFTLSSPAFAHGGEIPAQYTCDGSNVSPALVWSGMPAATKSFVLMVADPDAPDPAAPTMTWVHWLLYNLPASAQALPAGATQFPVGTLSGLNDWKRTGYGGPCPPIGRHRYVHTLYALDILLADLRHPSKAVLETKMQGHIIAQAELIGTYQRHK